MNWNVLMGPEIFIHGSNLALWVRLRWSYTCKLGGGWFIWTIPNPIHVVVVVFERRREGSTRRGEERSWGEMKFWKKFLILIELRLIIKGWPTQWVISTDDWVFLPARTRITWAIGLRPRTFVFSHPHLSSLLYFAISTQTLDQGNKSRSKPNCSIDWDRER